jgi:hypothetical protein
MGGYQGPSAGLLRAFDADAPSPFVDDFTYPAGTLWGNGGWFDGYGMDDPGTDGAAAILDNLSGAAVDLAPTHHIDFTAPWQCVVVYRRIKGGDSTNGALKFLIGDAPFACVISLNYISGDGGNDLIDQVTAEDAAANQAFAGPLASINTDDHTVTVTFDGTGLVLNYDGVDVASLLAADMGSPGTMLGMFSLAGPALQQFVVKSVAITPM